MSMRLPPLLSLDTIRERLNHIFPEGTPHRQYCVRDTAVRTVFVMLYVGAVEGTERYIRPNLVIRMTDNQAALVSEDERLRWTKQSLKPSTTEVIGRWYAADTREPIRDETLRTGLIQNNAVIERKDLPTNSPKAKYALKASFASLFEPKLLGRQLEGVIGKWQTEELSAPALARSALVRRATVAGDTGVRVTFPNGEARLLAEGPSSVIAKAVIEEFSKRFLERPGVIFLSESRKKVVARDEELARAIGLHFPAERLLPDIVLVDIGPTEPILIFVEVVATDGPIDSYRKQELLRVAGEAGFDASHLAFVTAYRDRDNPAFRRTMSSLAWGSFAWFLSEPDHIITLWEGGVRRSSKLSQLL